MKRKLLSVFLSLCMMLTLVPGALATGTEQPTDPTDSGGETSVTVNDASSLKSALESAAEGATITLGQDFSVEAGPENNFTLSKPVTINGNGHTITRAFNEVSTDGYGDYEAVFVITSAGVTIQNVTLAGLDKGQKDEAGIYISGNGTETSEITISACKFIGAETATAPSGGTGIISCGNSSAYLTVTDCQFTNLKYGMYFNGISQAAITGNQIDGTKYTGIYLEGSNVTIEDNVLTNIASENYDNAAYASGIYVGNSSESSAITIADSNEITLHENVTHGVPVVNAKAAKVGETEYATIQEALNTIGESSSLTVTLLSDVVLSAPVQVPAGKEITIQGENHTILYPVSVGAAFSGTNGISSNTKLTVNGVNFKISDAAESPATGFAVLVGEGTNGVNIAMNGCSFTNLYAGVYFGHVEAGSTGSISITDSTYHNSRYGYSIDEVTNGSLVGGVTVSFTGNTTNGTAEKEPWNSITVTSGTTTKGYSSWTAAYEAAQAGDIITLNMDVATSALTIEKQITLNGNGHTISYNGDASESSPANGALITIQGENANNVTIQNLTVDTQGKVKHGVQFYCVTDGQLEDATVNGGAYTSVIVNGAEVSLTNCTLNPAKNAYANIEYGIGSGVTTQPEIILSNVTGNAEKPLVYADKTTADKFKAEGSENESYADIAEKINEKLTGADVTIIVTGDDGKVDEENSVVGTQLYTITLDANGGTVETSTLTTNNEGKLSDLPNPNHSNNKYTFQYWTLNGTEVTEDTVFTGDATIVAQWSYSGGGGGGGGSVTTKYTLTFDTNGGSAIAKVTKEKGTTVDLEQYVPTREGYTFAGWYSDEALTQKVTSVKLNANTTVYAKWTENAVTPTLPF
ncbi:MAG: InlB B-repeat-containing protein, partial [Evtepia sp.]|nr:InlB B-repeat-containing protein [Evtepia sp.]